MTAKRKLITITTSKGRTVTNNYTSSDEAVAAVGPTGLYTVTVEPVPYCGVGPCDDCIGCDDN
jgi:hypothetical protein